MELLVLRIASGKESTVGALFDASAPTPQRPTFLCFTLEDQFRQGPKVHGETRIPAGRYGVKLRTEGRLHSLYATRYGPDWHKGMLWLQDVPGFQWILVHVGNTGADTEGCLIVGDQPTEPVTQRGRLERSTASYERIYPPIAAELVAGRKVWITYLDFDLPQV